MTTRWGEQSARVAVASAAVVAGAAVLRVSPGTPYALAGWPGDPRASAVAAWATWATAGLIAAAAMLSDVPRAVRVALAAAALLVVIEEGDLPGADDAGLLAVAVVGGAVLPAILGVAVVGSALPATGLRASPVWGALAVAAGCGVAGAVLIDPRLHGCGQCQTRPWGSTDLPVIASGLATACVVLSLAAALLATVSAGAARRRGGTPGWAGAVVLGGWLSLLVLSRYRMSGPLETPTGPARALLVGGLLVAGVGAVWPRVDMARRREQLVRTVARVGSEGGTSDVESAVRRAVQDPSLLVAYGLEGGDLVDATGAPVSVDGLHVSTVERGDGTVVLLAGTRRLDPQQAEVAVALAWPLLAVQLESARVAFATRRLTVARRASVEEVDRENRLLGRDLHDGAQQQLVSLMIGIRVAADRAGGSAELEAALADVQAALDEVRRIAHGDLPDILQEQGLEAALGELAGDVPGAVVLVEPGCATVPDVVRNTIYLVAAACLRTGATTGPPPAVRIWRAGDLLRLRTDGVVLGDNDDVTESVIARVRALGGRWCMQGRRLEVDLSCA